MTKSYSKMTTKSSSSKKKAELILTTKDAVFGRGRKRDHVRKGSLYRHLIEMYWLPYSELDTSKFAMRRAFVKSHILDVLVHDGGRFIVRSGPAKILLDPSDPTDLKLIFKKVQRALFNEKKRQEQKQGISFESKNLEFDFEVDMPVPVSPLSMKMIKMEDVSDDEEGEEDSDEEEQDDCADLEEEEEDDDLIHPEEVSSGASSMTTVVKCKTATIIPEDDWDFKIVNGIKTQMASAFYAPAEEEVEEEAEEEEDDTLVEAAKAAMVAEDCYGRRSSEKLDQLADLASVLLGKQDEEESDKKMPAKDNDNNLVICDVSCVVVETSKPLKKRNPRFVSYKAFEDEMVKTGASNQFNSFVMERLNLKPRVGDFYQHCEEYGSL